MSDVLARIKRAIIIGQYVFSEKAELELEANNLTKLDVLESIVNAKEIYKKIRSRSPLRSKRKEYLYIIQSANLDGIPIYTKGKLMSEGGVETYYFFVSSKKAWS